MDALKFISIKDKPKIIEDAALWFSSKWNVPKEAYLECMKNNIEGKTNLGWYLCLDGEKIIGGLGAVENDFHDRKDLTPNICAVYVEEKYRNRGIAGKLLLKAVSDLKNSGISPVFLVTDHIGFYEKYGFEFFTMVKCDDRCISRAYIHR